MRYFIIPLVLLTFLSVAHSQNIVQAEWFIAPDPGMGNGNPITASTPNDSVGLNFAVPVDTLSPGTYQVFVRSRSNNGTWGVPQLVKIFKIDMIPSVANNLNIDQVEHWTDSDPPTLDDVTDSSQVNISESISTTSLYPGRHHTYIRCRDNSGRWGVVERRPFFMVNLLAATLQPKSITAVEYWTDSNPPTFEDVTDTAQVNINELISTLSLEAGRHHIYFRGRDDSGRWGVVERRPIFILNPPTASSQLGRIVSAEFFVNVDPGEGNGVAIPLPVDGVWDEGEETVQTIITGVPIGLHLVGIRTRDEVGRWSATIADTLLVGPILTIHTLGNNVILDWLSGTGADAFHIYRSSTTTGPFAQIDSTTAQSYTDYGIITTDSKSFYQVTFSPNTLSTFRLPNGNSANKMTQ